MTVLQAEDLAFGADTEYWNGLLQGRPKLQQCEQCHAWHWPAVWRCSACGSWEHRWCEVELSGRVYSWTRNWHPFDGLEDFTFPFVTVVVQLEHESGVRLVGIMEGDESVEIGKAVTGAVETRNYAGDRYPSIRWS